MNSYHLRHCFSMRRHFWTGWMSVGLSLACAFLDMSSLPRSIIVTYQWHVVVHFVAGYILEVECCLAPDIRPRMDISFVRIEEELHYEIRPARMLSHLQRSAFDSNILQDYVIPHVSFCWCDYPFPMVWFSTRCEHSRESFGFEPWFFRERKSPMSIFVLWHCVDTYHISGRDCGQFCVPVACFDGRGL